MIEKLNELQSDLLDKYSGVQWIGRDCDGCLWNALAKIAGVKSIKLHLAEPSRGEWRRRPYPFCYPDHSKSTTSNDMLTGLLYALYKDGDKWGLIDLWTYGVGNWWVMGKGPLARTWLRPNGIFLLAKALFNLTGKKTWGLWMPNLYFPVRKDYERHLQTIGCLFSAELTGGLTRQMGKRILENAKYDKNDALFAAAAGCTGIATALILDENYPYPSYIRGDEAYQDIHKLFVIYVIKRFWNA